MGGAGHLNQKAREELVRRLARCFPDPKTELNYRTPFELLVAVLLSAQTSDKQVNRVTRQLFAVANTPEKISCLDRAVLEDYLKPLGLYKVKAGYLHKLTTCLLQQYDGRLPTYKIEFLKLPGVGPKTANVVWGILYQAPVLAVDTHVFRVCNRTGLALGNNVRMVEKQLMRQKECRSQAPDLHHWLVLHGRYVCLARKPACDKCCLQDLCLFYRSKGAVNDEKSVGTAATRFTIEG